MSQEQYLKFFTRHFLQLTLSLCPCTPTCLTVICKASILKFFVKQARELALNALGLVWLLWGVGTVRDSPCKGFIKGNVRSWRRLGETCPAVQTWPWLKQRGRKVGWRCPRKFGKELGVFQEWAWCAQSETEADSGQNLDKHKSPGTGVLGHLCPQA